MGMGTSRRAMLTLLGSTLAGGCTWTDNQPLDRVTDPLGDTGNGKPADGGSPGIKRATDSRTLYRNAGSQLTALTDADDAEMHSGSATVDRTTGFTTGSSLEVTGTDEVLLSLPVTLDAARFEPSVACRLDTGRKAQVDLVPEDDHGQSRQYSGLINETDGWLRLNAGVIDADEGFTGARTSILKIRIRSTGRFRAHLDDIRRHPRADQARCILTFDDATVSHYEKAFPVMQEFGYPGAASIPAYFPANNEQLDMLTERVAPEDTDPLTRSQLEEMIRQGWEVGAEMYTHPQSAKLPRYEVEREARMAKRWLTDNGLVEEPAFLTYPYGSHDAEVLDEAATYYAFGRTVGLGLNRPTITNPLHVSGHSVYSENITYTKRKIDTAAANNQVLILNFHGFDRYAWKPMRTTEFREIISYLETTDSIMVTTYSEWWNQLPTLHNQD